MRALPPYEQATLDLDLPVLEAWASRHPDRVAGLVVDRAGFEAGIGHVLLIVEIHDHTAVRRTHTELAPLLSRPEHLRVRTRFPEPVDLHVPPDRPVPLPPRVLTPYEQATLDLDLPVLKVWAEEHPGLVAEVNVDRQAFDSNVGHVVLVLEVRDHTAVRRTQAEVGALLQRPEHLRVRVWAPDPAELELLSRLVWDLQSTTDTQIAGTGPDPVTGLLQVALDRRDPEFTARLRAIHPGWIQVLPDPQEMPVPLARPVS
ncbi:hypothetical protein [Kribbella lupini]|uniref:Uncharacterized protein n=1 Tax=Kribbella lupini TaxID=291602 RepID=A0ABP4L446_9ACTN